ncbi:hypothetical protein LJC36_05575 [Desulfovibrio sp. OttesenSCG-928-C14]|nr:hypothetical protein [Desulfovibrio sp. OttesenSCG-928-C14]
MDTRSYYTRRMLLQYGRQLISSRRLARYQQLLGLGRSEEGISPLEQRSLMVDRITREVIENLIFTGSTNPVVLEVKDRLKDEFGDDLTFYYPPGSLDFRIVRGEGEEQKEVSADEKRKIMEKLLDITHETVSCSML